MQHNIYLRSLLLKAVPDPRVGIKERLTRIIKRAITLVLTLWLLFRFMESIHSRWWPIEGIGKTLYQMHDNLYLVLKGHLWHRTFPISLGFVAFTLTVVLIVLASWLSDRSFLRQSHVRILRLLLQRPLQPLLLESAKRFARFRFLPHLLLLVAHYERCSTAIDLIEAGPSNAPPDRCTQLVNYALFAQALEKNFTQYNPLVAIESCYFTFLLVEIYGTDGPEKKQLLNRLSKQIYELLKVNHALPSEVRSPFTYQEIFSDLRILIAPDDRVTSDKLARIHFTTESRRWIFEQILWSFEEQFSGVDTSRAVEIPNFGLDFARVIGRLARLIAVHLAWRSSSPSVIELYDEAVDSLLMMSAALEGTDDSHASLIIAIASGEPEDKENVWESLIDVVARGIAQELRLRSMQKQAVIWKNERTLADGLVQPQDFALEQMMAHLAMPQIAGYERIYANEDTE